MFRLPLPNASNNGLAKEKNSKHLKSKNVRTGIYIYLFDLQFDHYEHRRIRLNIVKHILLIQFYLNRQKTNNKDQINSSTNQLLIRLILLSIDFV
jgi:hypothetical protein